MDVLHLSHKNRSRGIVQFNFPYNINLSLYIMLKQFMGILPKYINIVPAFFFSPTNKNMTQNSIPWSNQGLGTGQAVSCKY